MSTAGHLSVMLRHRFAAFALDLDFTAPDGITILFGPSGSGKTTVLSAIAGLFRPGQSRIAIGDTMLADSAAGLWLPPEQRRIGIAFQDARLFPHMSVLSNLRYGLRRAAATFSPPGPIRLDDVVDLLGIGALLDRRPRALSGGERARVAIGRALLSQPRLLLLDEPLASLDAARRAEIMPYLLRLRSAARLPIVYVTHAMEEVVALADHVVLLESGRVTAAGPLAETAIRGPLALRDDAGAVIAAVVSDHDPARQLTRLSGLAAPILVPLLARPLGSEVRVRIPAREVILARTLPVAISVQNAMPGLVHAITHDLARHASLVEVMVGTQAILARVTPDAVTRLDLAIGVPVYALFKSVGVTVLARE